MPTYEYVCRACDHEFELFQSMTAPVKKKCPECGKLKLERLIGTGAGVIFKGGGFYETDYRTESYKKGAEAEKKASEKKSDSSGDSKSESKSDSKSDAKKTETTSSSDSKSKPKSNGAKKTAE